MIEFHFSFSCPPDGFIPAYVTLLSSISQCCIVLLMLVLVLGI